MVAGRAWQRRASELTQTMRSLPPPPRESTPGSPCGRLRVSERWGGGRTRPLQPTLTTAASDSS